VVFVSNVSNPNLRKRQVAAAWSFKSTTTVPGTDSTSVTRRSTRRAETVSRAVLSGSFREQTSSDEDGGLSSSDGQHVELYC
jgi:hypothetical protein